MNIKKVAITGAGGFLGSHLKEKFLRAGWSVLGLGRREFELGRGLEAGALFGVDALVHCAYDFGANTWAEIQRVNVAGSKKLFECAARDGVKKIIFISTVSAFDGCKSMYGRAKLEIERLAASVGAWILRPGLIYGGAGSTAYAGIFGKLKKIAEKFPVVPVFDHGNQKMVLTHIDDLTDAILKITQLDAAASAASVASALAFAGPIIAASEQFVTFKEILSVIAARVNKKIFFVSISSRFALLCLRALEIARIRLPFKSDSLTGLINVNPYFDFSNTRRLGLKFRNFL